MGTTIVTSSSVSTTGGTTTTTTTSSPAPASEITEMVADTAEMATKGGGAGAATANILPTLHRVSSISQAVVKNVPSLPTDSDGDGWREYTNVGSTILIQLCNSAGTALSDAQIFAGATIAKIKVKISSTYTAGQWEGVFEVVLNGSSEIMSGTITASDPVGGSFTETLSNIEMETITISGQSIGVPVNGTSSLTGTFNTNGVSGSYTGAFTYGKSGSTYTHNGTITYENTVVAQLFLTFSTSFGNYTGYFIDVDGNQHTIQ